MIHLAKTRAVRVLLGVVILATGAAGLVRPAAVVQGQEAGISLEAKWLVLRQEDVGSLMVQVPDQVSSDGRGQLTVRRFDPDFKGREDHPPTPSLVLDKLWLANDTATSQQIFREQAEAGFPEARLPVTNVGGIELPPLGEEARGIGGCGPCDGGVVHYRIVFRYLNAVHALYVYGSDQYAYVDVARGYARILNERVRAVPNTSTAADVAVQVAPRQVALSGAELGAEINTLGDQEGADERAQWYSGRFNRQKEFERSHIGPLDIYNKVWVARDVEAARQIFAEQAVPGFPEARETVGKGNFPMEALPGIGNDNFGWSACNEDCNTEFFRFLHHRYVWRAGNVVVVLYTWGGNQDNSVNQVSFYAQSMRSRIK